MSKEFLLLKLFFINYWLEKIWEKVKFKKISIYWTMVDNLKSTKLIKLLRKITNK